MVAVIFLVPFLKGGPFYLMLKNDPSLGIIKFVLFFITCSGFWICLASKPVEDGLGVLDKLPFKKNIIIHTAYLSQLIGIPFMVLILSDGDTGIIYIWWVIFAFFSLVSWLFTLKKKPWHLRVRYRRYIIILFTVASAWYCTEYLVERIIVEQGHISSIIKHYKNGSITGLALDFLEFIILSLLFIVPYTVMVIFPRIGAGEFERPVTWIKRFGWFVVSVFIMLCIKTIEVYYNSPK